MKRSGLIWLTAAVVAAGAAVAAFAGGLGRWAVDVTVIDDAITRRVAGAPVPGFTAAASVIAEAGAALATVIAGFLLLLALIALVLAGRWRRRGGWATAAFVAVTGLSLMRLSVAAPTDVLLGAILGVSVPLPGCGCSPRMNRSRWSTAARTARILTSAAPAARRSGAR